MLSGKISGTKGSGRPKEIGGCSKTVAWSNVTNKIDPEYRVSGSVKNCECLCFLQGT